MELKDICIKYHQKVPKVLTNKNTEINIKITVMNWTKWNNINLFNSICTSLDVVHLKSCKPVIKLI